MNSSSLGKRYERLSFFSGILSFMCIAILLTAIAITDQKDKNKNIVKCMGVATVVLEKNNTQLQIEYDIFQTSRKFSKNSPNLYKWKLYDTWISPGFDSGCHELIREYLEKYSELSAKNIIDKFNEEIELNKKQPLQVKDIKIESNAKIELLGAKIFISLESLVTAFQIATGPMLLLWLGSLYNTRFRETKLISKITNITGIYPHLINVYPVVNLPSLRKWSKVAYKITPSEFAGLIYSLIRAFLVILIIMPAVGSYIYGLIILPMNDSIPVSYIMGSWIGITTFAVIIVELMPWHVYKVFSANT